MLVSRFVVISVPKPGLAALRRTQVMRAALLAATALVALSSPQANRSA